MCVLVEVLSPGSRVPGQSGGAFGVLNIVAASGRIFSEPQDSGLRTASSLLQVSVQFFGDAVHPGEKVKGWMKGTVTTNDF